jgi:hypothetical protein
MTAGAVDESPIPDGNPKGNPMGNAVGGRLALGVGMTALAMMLRIPTFATRLFDPDEAAISVQAMVVRSGGTLYRDIYDRKPPLPPLLYAGSFSLTNSNDVRPMRVLVAVLLALSGILVAFDFKRRLGSRAAWCGGAVMIVAAMSLFPADAGAANYAHFAILPGTAAILWTRRGTALTAVLAGLALGAALLCRQSWLLGVIPACVSIGRSGRWRNVVPFGVAMAATVATTGFYAPLGRFWEWNVTNSPGFVFAGSGVVGAVARGLASLSGFVVFHPTVVAAAAVVAAAGVATMRSRQVPADIDLWLWVGSGLAAWAAGVRFFGHYWLQIIPPLVILAVPVLVDWWDGTRRVRHLALAGIIVPCAVAWGLLFVPGSFHHRPETSALAAYVTAHTTAADRVFVWGSYPELLVAADRLPAGRLVHTDFVVGRSGGRTDPAETMASAVPGAAELMLDDLTRNPPALIVDTSTAASLGYSKYPMSLLPELQHFVSSDYQRLDVIAGVTIWGLQS